VVRVWRQGASGSRRHRQGAAAVGFEDGKAPRHAATQAGRTGADCVQPRWRLAGSGRHPRPDQALESESAGQTNESRRRCARPDCGVSAEAGCRLADGSGEWAGLRLDRTRRRGDRVRPEDGCRTAPDQGRQAGALDGAQAPPADRDLREQAGLAGQRHPAGNKSGLGHDPAQRIHARESVLLAGEQSVRLPTLYLLGCLGP